MKSYSASTTIGATPEKVWAVLIDTKSYPEWDPGMIRVEGHLALGQKVKFFTKFSPDRAFSVEVTSFEPGKKLTLTGGMPFGLFKSERTSTLSPREDGSIEFSTEETFSGLLFPLFSKKMPDLTESFEAFVRGLKGRAEGMQVG